MKRKQQTNKHAPLAIMLCLLLLFSSFSFVSAEDSNIVELPLVKDGGTPSTTDLINNGVLLYSGNAFSSSVSIYVGTSLNSSPIYCGLYLNESNYLYAVFAVDNSLSGYNAYATKSNGNPTNINFNAGTFTSSSSGIIYETAQYPIGTNTSGYQYTPFSSFQEFVDAIGTSSGGGGWSGQATVSVEAGCVAYILVDGGTATLTTTFPELSKLSRPLWVSGSTYSFENDLPSSGKVFSSTSGTLIDWLIPASAKTDLLGRSYQGGRPLSDLPSGQFLVVYNPVYRGYDDKGVGIMSPTIYVSLSNYGAVRQYRLTASYNGGLIESTSDDGYSSWFDSIGEEELDVNGNPVYIEHLANGTTQTAISIPSGGGNIVINGDNADNSIGGLLERLLSLLTAPIKYIERLYNSAIQFFDYLSSLWGWLPVEVTSIIGAALAVLVVIGVVKFLWK